jgi:hypothetical protein
VIPLLLTVGLLSDGKAALSLPAMPPVHGRSRSGR